MFLEISECDGNLTVHGLVKQVNKSIVLPFGDKGVLRILYFIIVCNLFVICLLLAPGFVFPPPKAFMEEVGGWEGFWSDS